MAETMAEPITRGELHDALETWTGALVARLDERFAKIDERFAKIDERFARIEATMVTRDYLEGRLANVATREDLVATREDLARHARAIMEGNAAQIAVLDEKYAELPARVDRLERAVYKRTKRAAPSRSPERRRR